MHGISKFYISFVQLCSRLININWHCLVFALSVLFTGDLWKSLLFQVHVNTHLLYLISKQVCFGTFTFSPIFITFSAYICLRVLFRGGSSILITGGGGPIDENQFVENSLFVNKQFHLNVFRA